MTEYWERRYASGGISGSGSRGAEAEAKAALLKAVLHRTVPDTILDLGCGDGVVISGVDVPDGYVGYDPSPTAVNRCRKLMPHRTFTNTIPEGQFDLVLSMDVMHHLVDDADYFAYLATLLGKARRHVLVYGTNHYQQGHSHVLHRKWTDNIPMGWTVEKMPIKHKTGWLLTWEEPKQAENVKGGISLSIGQLLERLASKVSAEQVIVEIGAYVGRSTAFLSRGVREGNGAHIISIDPHGLPGSAQGRGRRWVGDHVRSTYLRNLEATGSLDNVEPVRALSGEAPLPVEPVGLLWIDGDHSLAAVRGDVERWGPLVAPGGVIVFDDYGTRHPGVDQVVHDIVFDPRWMDWDNSVKPVAWGRKR